MEQLRAAALRAYPEVGSLAEVNITGGLIEVWDRLARAAGVTTREFADGIADALGLLAADTLFPYH